MGEYDFNYSSNGFTAVFKRGEAVSLYCSWRILVITVLKVTYKLALI
jgi:hypothetical protein